MNPSILFENTELVAIDKPPGIAVHDAPGPGQSLLKNLKTQLGTSELFPVHRLDKDASGVLLFARMKEVARELERVWSERENPEKIVLKTYWAICLGVPEKSEGVIDAPILENQTGKPERLERALNYFKKMNPEKTLPPLPTPKTSAVHPAGRSSQTHYKVLEVSKDKKISWLEVRPEQGRMHQIRVHLAQLGHPLLVDQLYGKQNSPQSNELFSEKKISLNRMPLHAYRLEIPNPGYLLGKVSQPRRIHFEAPMPSDMAGVLNCFR